MKVNFFVEDMLFFKYIGCATLAKTLYNALVREEPRPKIAWNAHGRDFDLVHYHTFGPLALTNKKYSHGVKVLTAHSTPRLNAGNLVFSETVNQFYPEIYGGFDHIITISPLCEREVHEIAPDVPTTLIPNGVNREKFQPNPEKRAAFRKTYGIGEDEWVVLTVAQQTPRKGIYDFLALSHEHPDIKFVWVGGFPYGRLSQDYSMIEEKKSRCGKNVLFTGFVDDITAAYCSADVFFIPSYAEGLPMVILEAFATGLPVVARRIPEFTGNFRDTALYFDNTEEAGMLLENRDLLGRHAALSRPFTEDYDIRTIANLHIDLYRKLAG
ncbi:MULTISPECIES: glycosyltransferase family 4 protein [Methanoculleus]|uniref:Glycosyl transferase, group 1 n=2 Tax=Methanoculleus TaxID=45989 RepID=A3CUG0_METMJ|nr:MULTISPECIES: glycosyltransferase family 4 protein [Methanoculleus]ABN57010.1 glycosyl transferase, group 1 [Methanoculleus marisnigri JR1]UYU18429.1 glycosyltransferase family 4 protein [Methanoculleus submarinus]